MFINYKTIPRRTRKQPLGQLYTSFFIYLFAERLHRNDIMYVLRRPLNVLTHSRTERPDSKVASRLCIYCTRNMYLLKIGFSRITPANLNGSRYNFTDLCTLNSNVMCWNFGVLGQRGVKWRRKRWVFFCNGYNELVTGSIAQSATRWYSTSSDTDFEVFRPAGVSCWTDGGEIWHGGGPLPLA